MMEKDDTFGDVIKRSFIEDAQKHVLPDGFDDRLLSGIVSQDRFRRRALIGLACLGVVFMSAAAIVTTAVVMSDSAAESSSANSPASQSTEPLESEQVAESAAVQESVAVLESSATTKESKAVESAEGAQQSESTEIAFQETEKGECSMNRTARVMAASLALSVASTHAGLIAKWDFNNYDSENPTSTNILAATVGDYAAIVATGNGSSTPVTDGTLGSVYVVDSTTAPGLADGDYALAIPVGSHVKFPLPSGVATNKSWMLRIRFYSPAASASAYRSLIQHNWNNASAAMWHISNLNLIQGVESIFGTNFAENQNTTSNFSTKQANGVMLTRIVSSDAWHSFTAHYGPTGASTTLDGVRSVSLIDMGDVRGNFTDDGFIVGANNNSSNERLIYITSVEVWEDMPIYNRNGYMKTSSTLAFEGCSLDDVRDLYLCIKGLGTYNQYGRVMSSFERIVTTNAEGAVSNLKVDFAMWKQDAHILAEFNNSGDDVYAHSLRRQHGLGWGSMYFTSTGEFVSSSNYGAAGTDYNSDSYTPYNIYVLPFIPFVDSLNWSYLVGCGKFGNPVVSIVGDNPTLTFNASPAADSLTLDCGRGDNAASVTFAYDSDDLKTMSDLGGLNIGENVKVCVPCGVSIAGAVDFADGASIDIDIVGEEVSEGSVLFTATGGITIPAGKSISDVITVAGSFVDLSQDGTQILLVPDPSSVITAVWTGLGDRSNVTDPLNWTCWNYAGTVLENRIPTSDTTITISGETSFNLPTNQVASFAYKTLTFNSPLTLTADCDWRGLGVGALSFVAGGTIEMNGYNLAVAGMTTGGSTVTIKNEAEETSEFHLDVASGTTVQNDYVAIGTSTGSNIKFVKEGDGTYVAAKEYQEYLGGTEITGGTAKPSYEKAFRYWCFGGNGRDEEDGSIVTVSSNGTFDVNNSIWTGYTTLILNGGTLYGTTMQHFSKTTLTADSSLETTGDFNSRCKFYMNGHTLSVKIKIAKYLMMTGFEPVGPGTIDVLSGGVFSVTNIDFTSTSNINLNMGAALHITKTLCVSNYYDCFGSDYNKGTGTMKVFGTFTPGTDYFYGCTMQDGSTIDLSGKSGTWSTTSSCTASECSNTVTFDDDATVKIKLGERYVPGGTKVVSWTTAPSNLDGLTFVKGDEDRQYFFSKESDGIYIHSPLIFIVR